MRKEQLTTHKAQKKRVSFIEKAIGEGVLQEIPISERHQNIALVYLLSELSAEKVRKAFPKPSGELLTRSSVTQITKRLLKEFWKHVSPQLRAKYPLRELLAKKPTALGEIASRVKRAVEGGVDPQTIGLTPVSIARVRKTLRKRGVEVPPRRVYANFAEAVRKEEDDKRLQAMLDSHSDESIRGYMDHHRGDKEKVFSSLYAIIKSAGFSPHFKYFSLFAEAIKKANIPIKKLQIKIRGKEMEEVTQIYWIVFAKHRQRILKILESDPDLQKFKKNPDKISKNIPAYL